MLSPKSWPRWVSLAIALAVLDISLSFLNVWPTPAITWHGDLSIELVITVLALVAASLWWRPPSRGVLRLLGIVWTVLVIGHYADVTAPALYGRSVNLYWDLQFVPAVAEMLASAASRWLVILVLLGAAAVLTVLYTILRRALGRVRDAAVDGRERRALGWGAAVLLALFIVQQASASIPAIPRFSTPVSATYARQARLVLDARAGAAGRQVLAPSPAMDSDLSLAKGADVLIVFVESYGSVTFDKPEFASALADRRSELAKAIRDTNRDVVSAYVTSPTFGGSSWLAHVSLLSGIEVRDPNTNALLMTQKRDTLVTHFARHGYRTIGMMPGMWQSWPEGVFYGFDDIYGGKRLDYHGPQFGWWDIPDQFAIARLDEREIQKTPRAPLFVFFPTVSTHIPFSPTPPYGSDWARLLTDDPFEADAVDRAFDDQPDWLDLGPSYMKAVSYFFESLTGYLRLRPTNDFVMVLLGDHQPAAAVTGEGASWDVPVHVIASRREVLDRLISHGFREGLTPAHPSLGPMPKLQPILLESLGNHETEGAGELQGARRAGEAGQAGGTGRAGETGRTAP